MWDFLTKKCGIFGIEGGTKLWDFQHQGGDFRPLTSGHTGLHSLKSSLKIDWNGRVNSWNHYFHSMQWPFYLPWGRKS